MTRCPSCHSDIGNRRVCPNCSANAAASRSRPSGGATGQNRAGNSPPPLPTGLKLVCGLLVLSGLVSIGVGTELQSIGEQAAGYGVEEAGGVETLGLLVLGVGLGQIAAGVGLWARKSWGWTATMGVTALGALSGLVLLSNGFTSSVGAVSLLYNGAVGWYVYQHRWRFRDEQGSPQHQRPGSRRRQRTGANRQDR